MFFHLAAIVLWVGAVSFFSFCSAPSIFKVLEREQAGQVVGDIFPKYWMVGYVCGVLSILTLVVASFATGDFPLLRLLVLLVMTVLAFYSGLVTGKQARAVKEEMRRSEDGEQKGKLRGEFKKLHIKSQVLNMAIFVLGVLVVYLTSLRF